MEANVTFESIVKYMNSMEFSGMKLGLDRIKSGLKQFGNPEKKLKIIHVAGTNGKGSVTAMVANILKESGKTVGMFTSPHLVDVRERIQVNGEMISKEEFRESFLDAKSKLVDLTFFELVTLMAVLYFVKKKVDYAVIEVGLGGKCDATNFENSLMSVITRIDLDHTNILGDTIEEIAEDKCGIIKKNQKVFTTTGNAKVLPIIERKCKELGSDLVVSVPTKYDVSLNGQFQKENAGIAVAIAKSLGVSEEVIQKGLKTVEWPGRADYLEDNVLFDCSHNPSGVSAISEYVKTLEYEKLIIVFGVSKNKDYRKMLTLLPEHDQLIVTQSSVSRRLSIDEMDIEAEKIRDPKLALKKAKEYADEKDLILVCGSIFLIGDLKAPE